MTLHDLITLTILPIGTSGYKEIQHIKYTSEHTMKLQIHQQNIHGGSYGIEKLTFFVIC